MRSGFALIELAVALAIGGLVLLAARMILEHLADGSDWILEAAAVADGEANGDRLLRRLVGQAAAAPVVSGAVSGDSRAVRLMTWCEVPGGWQETCEVELSLQAIEGAPALMATFPGGAAVLLRGGFTHGEFLFLADARAGGTWLNAWRSELTTPLAVGVVLDRDTLIVRIGERG